MSSSQTSSFRYELHDPDVKLMLQVRDDDAAAFEELMLRYQNRVLLVLENVFHNRHLAEDLTQDVFLRVFRARKTYVPGSKFSTWLFTIVNNVAANSKRTRARRREVHVEPVAQSGALDRDAMENLAVAASGALPTRALDKAEMRDVVRVAVGGLSERQRMAMLLSRFENLSHAEIAEAMNLSPQAIKSLLARARENLRACLEPYLESGERPAVTKEAGS